MTSEVTPAKCLGELGTCVEPHSRRRLWLQILVGMALGIGVGLVLASGETGLSPDATRLVACWLALPGHIFLALIQMVVVPLVLSSIVVGVVSTGSGAHLRRLGVRLGPYFLFTTTIAVSLGLWLGMVIEPGRYLEADVVARALGSTDFDPGMTSAPESKLLPERLSELIPSNPIEAALNQSMLQIVILALLLGVAALSIPAARAKPVVALAESLQEISMTVVSWAMSIAPIAVFGLLAQITSQVGLDAILGVFSYMATVLVGLALLIVFYLALVATVARRSPVQFMRAAREPQLLAFSTSSSAAVMPLSLTTAEEKLGVRSSVSQFVIPLGATVNMDGTALYQVVAAVFLLQVFDIELTAGALIFLVVSTIGASIGAPSSPGVGIVVLATVLTGLGVPAAGVALLLGVDRILDMSRTVVNVTGDLTACLVLDRWLGDQVDRHADTAAIDPELVDA